MSAADIHYTAALLQGAAMNRLLTGFRRAVIGKRITGVGYLDLHGEPYPVLVLEDGESIICQCDDEGNGPGTLSLGNSDAVLCRTSFVG